jgi:hypothetical protein
MRDWICGAQGQMSQDLANGLWISVDCDWWREMHRSFGAKSAPEDDKSLETEYICP